MKFIYKRRFIRRIVFGTLVSALLIFTVIFIVIPIIYRYSYVFQRNLLFLNFVTVPVDFKHPKTLNLKGAQNFYVDTNENITIGVWHLLPARLILNSTIHPEKDTISWLNHGEPIFMYLHGNSGNRGTSHRIQLYQVLQANNFHVVAFDYRSYGDSSPTPPTEEGVVNDSKFVYKWLKEKAGHAKIFLWGHSLGTGISSHLIDILESENEIVSGLVLESPFNNMSDEIRSYPLAKFFKYLPWFEFFFIEPMYKNGFRFESDVHLKNVKAPIMILHAEDDIVVPACLGRKLYDSIKTSREENNSESPLVIHVFPKSDGYGHKFICKAKELPFYINNFIKQSKEYKQLS